MASMEKCNLDELLEALSEMDQAAIQQEKLNTKLQAELHAQTHELGRLHAELAAAPAPDAPVAQPPVSPGKMRCFPVWIAAIAGFCLLLMSCNFFQAALENRSFEHLVQKTFLQRFLAPSPSLRLSADASQTSSEDYSDQGISKQPKIDEVEKASGSNSRKVQQLSTTWEGNASSGDELAMITPAPSKFVKQAGTSVHEELEDKSELAKRETRGDRATPTSTEADDTSRQEENEEKQPEPKKQVVDVDMASASEEPSAEAQGAKETQAGTEADDTSRQEENEEKQPEPKKQAEVDMASASEEPSAEAQGAKEAQTFTEADDTSRQEDNEEKQPDPHKQAEVDMASASEEPSAEAHGEKGVRSSIEADASRFGEAPSRSNGWHEEISEIDGFIPACDKLGGLGWKKDGNCGNVTPWPDLCFLKGGSRTTPECGLSVSEETVEPPFHWSFASLLAISEKIWEAEEIAERGLGGAIGLLAGAWCFW